MKFDSFFTESCVDDFGDSIVESDSKVYSNSDNTSIISEAGLSRVLQQSKDKEFAIITAYRDLDKQGKKLSKEQKIQRNRELRGILNFKKLGVYQLVGHWQECTDSSVEYDKCPKDKLVDVVERSYLVPNSNMKTEEFEQFILTLVKKFEQDAAILKTNNIYILEKTGKKVKIGSDIKLNKINQAYSQFVKKMNIPFVFEGIECPTSISSRLIMRASGVLWN